MKRLLKSILIITIAVILTGGRAESLGATPLTVDRSGNMGATPLTEDRAGNICAAPLAYRSGNDPGKAEIKDREAVVTVKDMAARDAIINSEGEILASSDLLFSFRGIREPADPVSENGQDRDWIFCEAETKNGRTVLSPVKDGSFRLDVSEDREIRFLWADRVTRELRDGAESSYAFRVKYVSERDLSPAAQLRGDGDEENGVIFIHGEKPVLTVKCREYAHSFISVKTGEEERIIEAEGDQRIEFEEGEYEIKIWGEDGWGVRYYSDFPIRHFIYDDTGPLKPHISLASLKSAVTEKGGYRFSDPVIITPGSEDSVSGVEKYIYRINNRINGAEYEAYGDRLQINPLFSGSITVKAVDRAGNSSLETVIDNLTVDSSDRSEIKEKKISNEGEDQNDDRSLKETDEERRDTKDDSPEENVSKKKDERKLREDPPGIYIRGFSDFEKVSRPVVIKAGIDNEFDGESIIIIEQHDEDGALKNLFRAEPGEIRISEEGNYVIRYIASGRDRDYEKWGYFTIDTSAPVLTSLKNIDGKRFRSFSAGQSLINSVRDYTYVDSRVTLSGRDYHGEKITEPGRYVLKLQATDELNHSSVETAEFLIVNDRKGNTGKKSGGTETEREMTGGGPLQRMIPEEEKHMKRTCIPVNTVSKGTISYDRVSQNEVRFSRPEGSAKEVTLSGNSRILIVIGLFIIFIPVSTSVLYFMKDPEVKSLS